jgi:acyl carrier protein
VTRDEVFSLIQRRLAEMMDRDVSEITQDTRLEEDLEADSLDLVELAMALEEELKLEIPDEQLEGIRTVGDAVEFVAERLGGDGED